MKASKAGKRRQQRRPSGRKRKARQVAQARRLPGKQVRGNHLPERTLHPQPEGLRRLSLHSHTLPPPLALLLLWVLDGVTACCAWLRAPLLRQWRHGLPALTLVALLSAAFTVASCGDPA